uniref:AlNc14C20G2107 protein n=1 Tax=Albugo laibachii Nc14 TaxID=890382 RepID=F0W5E1_9STRA|nr:AlNc14C20G2107 [Albugo laibachii Nc14]|eukprot:CCA16332.1 AlNc14C20G2107 [Albugo laibachii Nc14]
MNVFLVVQHRQYESEHQITSLIDIISTHSLMATRPGIRSRLHVLRRRRHQSEIYRKALLAEDVLHFQVTTETLFCPPNGARANGCANLFSNPIHFITISKSAETPIGCESCVLILKKSSWEPGVRVQQELRSFFMLMTSS